MVMNDINYYYCTIAVYCLQATPIIPSAAMSFSIASAVLSTIVLATSSVSTRVAINTVLPSVDTQKGIAVNLEPRTATRTPTPQLHLYSLSAKS